MHSIIVVVMMAVAVEVTVSVVVALAIAVCISMPNGYARPLPDYYVVLPLLLLVRLPPIVGVISVASLIVSCITGGESFARKCRVYT